MAQKQLDSALDLLRRLPPREIEDSLADLLDLVPDLTDSLLSAVDQPLATIQDTTAHREFIQCDYNRDGDSFRSPWTNTYFPPLSDGATPPAAIREIELKANDVFDYFRMRYFNGGVSSVYCWDMGQGAFAAAVLITKHGSASGRSPIDGAWDSIHVVEVTPGNPLSTYKLTSTILLCLNTSDDQTGKLSLSGSFTRQLTRKQITSKMRPHVVNIGTIVQELENAMREQVSTVYFQNTLHYLDGLHSIQTKEDRDRAEKSKRALAKDYTGA